MRSVVAKIVAAIAILSSVQAGFSLTRYLPAVYASEVTYDSFGRGAAAYMTLANELSQPIFLIVLATGLEVLFRISEAFGPGGRQ